MLALRYYEHEHELTFVWWEIVQLNDTRKTLHTPQSLKYNHISCAESAKEKYFILMSTHFNPQPCH